MTNSTTLSAQLVDKYEDENRHSEAKIVELTEAGEFAAVAIVAIIADAHERAGHISEEMQEMRETAIIQDLATVKKICDLWVLESIRERI